MGDVKRVCCVLVAVFGLAACREPEANFPMPPGSDDAAIPRDTGTDLGADRGGSPVDLGTDLGGPVDTPRPADTGPRDAAMDAGRDTGPGDIGFDAPRDNGTPPADQGPAPTDRGPAPDGGTVDVPRDIGPLNDGAFSGIAEGMSPEAIPERRVRCTTNPPGVVRVTAGAADRYVLRGRVAAPGGVINAGEVLVVNGLLACVAASCAGRPGYDGATRIDTAGVIHPGMVNAHDHPQYSFLPPWQVTRRYTNSGQWASTPSYRDFTQVLRENEGTYTCQMVKWGELRALVSGTTTLQGAPNRNCVTRTLVRNIEYGADFGGVDTHRPNTLGIDTVTSADAMDLRRDMDSGALTAYLLHLSEGIDEVSRREYDQLVMRNMLARGLVAIHGTAFRAAEFAAFGMARARLVWSPRSNVILYGRTTDVGLALDNNVPIALAPDWTPSGGPNLLAELRYARAISTTYLNRRLSDRRLVEMATSEAATVVDRTQTGSLVEGRYADLVVVPDHGCDAWATLIDTPTADVRLVMVGGRPLYGDTALMEALPAAAQARCESVSFCGQAKRICVALAATDNLLNQGLADIERDLRTFTTPYPLVPLCP